MTGTDSQDQVQGCDSPIVELFAAARDDPVVLGALLEGYREFLRAEVRHRVSPDHRRPYGDSALIQDTLLTACRHFAAFRGRTAAELACWLRIILRRLSMNQARDRHRLGPEVTDELPDPDADADSEPPDPGLPPPDDLLARREEADAVRGAVGNLSADHRTALDLRFRENLPFDEIGRRLGRSADAARKLVTRAVREVGGRLDHLR